MWKIIPALDLLLRDVSLKNINELKQAINDIDPTSLKNNNIKILVPLIMKLNEIGYNSQDFRTGIVDCLILILSRIYLTELTALKTIVSICHKQIWNFETANWHSNVSEELKLATIECIGICFSRSTGDVLNQFYCVDTAGMLGQLLLSLVDVIQKERYKKLCILSIKCLMSIFYVHDESNANDIELRGRVANVLFIFLPKIVTVLTKKALGDEKLGDTLRIIAVKALSQILYIIYEDKTLYDNAGQIEKYDIKQFYNLAKCDLSTKAFEHNMWTSDNINLCNPKDDILDINQNSKETVVENMRHLQKTGRTNSWLLVSSRRLGVIFQKLFVLRAHHVDRLREEYGKMCCNLILYCNRSLYHNFSILLESVIALTEDKLQNIADLSQKTLNKIQCQWKTYDCSNQNVFLDECIEKLFDEHVLKLPRILQRCDESEQYSELLFLKGFFKSLQTTQLEKLFAGVSRNKEMLCTFLCQAIDFKIGKHFLEEQHNYLLQKNEQNQENLYTNIEDERILFPWRQYRNLSSKRCIRIVMEICNILGSISVINDLFMDHLMDSFCQQSDRNSINEVLLIMLWFALGEKCNETIKKNSFVKQIINVLLIDDHWNLVFEPDENISLKVHNNINWFIDRTPGLYENSIEIRTQDCDSDNSNDDDINNNNTKINYHRSMRVTLFDVKVNVLHTSLVLDVLGHCFLYMGKESHLYILPILHKILLKIANAKLFVHQAAFFTLKAIKESLGFTNYKELIEHYIDYLTFQLNLMIKKKSDDSNVVDILSVILQFGGSDIMPYLDEIISTVSQHFGNPQSYKKRSHIYSYLRLFNIFLQYISEWLQTSEKNINEFIQSNLPEENSENNTCDNILESWLCILNVKNNCLNSDQSENLIDSYLKDEENVNAYAKTDQTEQNEDLPCHIRMVKTILYQSSKFIFHTEQCHQIMALECLILGVPLLRNYEDVLLPLVHTFWTPLMEKFRQKDAIILNRCFTLYAVVAQNARDFITKRSLDYVIPYYRDFLQDSAAHTHTKVLISQTQEYKLQLKLLTTLPEVIQNLKLDDKHLLLLVEAVLIYLSKDQLPLLQDLSKQFFNRLRLYNSPLIYGTLKAGLQSDDKVSNIQELLKEF